MYFDHIQNINNANYSNLPFIWQLFNNIFYTLTRDHRRIAMVQYTFTGHFFLKFLIISYIKKKTLRIQQLIESISRSSRKKMCKKSVAIRTFFLNKICTHTQSPSLVLFFKTFLRSCLKRRKPMYHNKEHSDWTILENQNFNDMRLYVIHVKCFYFQFKTSNFSIVCY